MSTNVEVIDKRLATLRNILATATEERRNHGPTCSCCKPTNIPGVRLVSKFSGFRQVCDVPVDHSCPGWHIREGSIEDAEAGLTVEQFCKVETRKFAWAASMTWGASMPSRNIILVKTLRLICAVVDLIRPCLQHDFSEWEGGPTCSECEVLGGYVAMVYTTSSRKLS